MAKRKNRSSSQDQYQSEATIERIKNENIAGYILQRTSPIIFIVCIISFIALFFLESELKFLTFPGTSRYVFADENNIPTLSRDVFIIKIYYIFTIVFFAIWVVARMRNRVRERVSAKEVLVELGLYLVNFIVIYVVQIITALVFRAFGLVTQSVAFNVRLFFVITGFSEEIFYRAVLTLGITYIIFSIWKKKSVRTQYIVMSIISIASSLLFAYSHQNYWDKPYALVATFISAIVQCVFVIFIHKSIVGLFVSHGIFNIVSVQAIVSSF